VQRDQDEERQADTMGIRFMRAAGYDPRELVTMLRHIHHGDAPDEDVKSAGTWQSSHPPGRVRIARAAREVDGADGGELGRDAYFAAIDGMVVGPDTERGVVRDRKFIHATSRFVLETDAAWKIEVEGTQMRGRSDESDKRLSVFMVPTPFEATAQALGATEPLEIAGHRAAIGWFVRGTEGDDVKFNINDAPEHLRIAVVDLGSGSFVIGAGSGDRALAASTSKSIIELARAATPEEVASTKPLRLTIVTADDAGSVAELVRVHCKDDIDIALALEAEPADSARPAKSKIKCARRP
jgi:predicted Zn-dependent protease